MPSLPLQTEILRRPATDPIRDLAGTTLVAVKQDDRDGVFSGAPDDVCLTYLRAKRRNDPFKKGGGPAQISFSVCWNVD